MLTIVTHLRRYSSVTHYSISQAAALLGFSVSALRRAANRGDVPCRRRPNGGYRFWLPSDIREIQAACQAVSKGTKS